MSETKTAIGTFAGIMEKTGGWHSVHVAMPGKEHPLKLDTKKEELLVLARAAGESVMEWTYTEEDSGTPNPHRPGSNFLNRRFEGVAPVGTSPQAASSVATPVAGGAGLGRVKPESNDGMTKEEWARKDSAIHKMACIKTAAAALTHTIPSDPTPEDLSKFLARCVTLTLAWHRSVLAERDDPAGEDVPF